MDEILLARVRALLGELSLLSDVPAAALGRSSASAESDQVGPRGEGTSLFDVWAARFGAEEDEGRVRTLVLLAERDLMLRRKRKPSVSVVEEDTAASEERILDWFEGVPADHAAIMESASGKGACSAAYIRKVRRRNDRDPEEGRPRPVGEQRVALVLRLQAEGMSIGRIAKELNLAKSSVHRAIDQAKRDASVAA